MKRTTPKPANKSPAYSPGHAGRRLLPNSFRLRLLGLLIAFSLGPLLVSNMWGYAVSRSYWVEMALRDVQHVARVEAARTFQSVSQRQRMLQSVMPGNEYLVARLDPREANNHLQQGKLKFELHEYLAGRAALTPGEDTLTLLSLSGDVLARSNGGNDDLGLDARCLEPPVDQTRILGLEAVDHEHSPLLIISTPVPGPDGDVIAVLCGQFPFEPHESLVAAHGDLSSDSVVYLLDEHRRVVCGSESPHDAGDHVESLHGRPEGLLEASGGRARRYDLPETGLEVMGAFEAIPQLGWGILVEVPAYSALSGLERLKWRAILFGSTFALALVVSIFAVARSLTGRISKVAGAAKRIADGSLGERIEVDGTTEIQNLAKAFNQMSSALHDSQQSLEDRIVERTRDLHESRELSELLLNSIEQRVVVVNTRGEIIKVNSTTRARYGDDLVGRLHSDVFPTHSEADNDVVRKTILTGVHQSKEYFESTLNGLDVEVVLWDMYPVNGDLGMTSVIGIGRSVSDEKRLQAQMLHQEKMASFGLLAAGVAHEIGNPLAAIKSQLHRVSNDPKSAPVTETFDVVNSEVGRIGRLLRDLIDFSRRPRDRVVLLSINQVIRDVTRLLEHDPRSRNVPVELELAEGLPGIRGREDGLFQVLLNLGLNALDAMPDGGHLKVLSRLANDEVVVKVSDCGSGIPQELWQRVFEPFFTTKDPERGTGLGLFVSRAIAADFGGRLSLEKSDAKGTTFAIHIAVQGPAPKERMS